MLEAECAVKTPKSGAPGSEILVEREASAVDTLAAVVVIRLSEIE